jgi:hypothetical protein
MSDAVSPSAESFYCFNCGYDLRGISSERCPECGMTIDWTAFASPISWEYRDRLGRVRAFFRTLVLATFSPKKIAAASVGPVDYRSAQRFRWIVVLLASLPLIGCLIGSIWKSGGTGFLSATDPSLLDGLFSTPIGLATPRPFWQFKFLWSAGATLLPIMPLGILLTIYLCTGIGGICFASRSLPPARQKRAVAISRYACAALGWMLIFVVNLFAIWMLDFGNHNWRSMIAQLLICLEIIGLYIIPIRWWWNTLRLLGGSTQPGAARLIAAGATIPIMWAGCAAIGLLVFPTVAGLLWLMFDSLR